MHASFFALDLLLLALSALAAPLPSNRTARPVRFVNASLHASANFMDCGTAPLCGVLVLESGDGSGAYSHNGPAVHGLWPETGSYGSSKCLKPADSSIPSGSATSCYDDLSFEQHEWSKHGVCAGAQDAQSYFTMLCGLAAAPIQAMSSIHANGGGLSQMATDLTQKSYPVFHVDSSSNSQIYLSACSSGNGSWKLAEVSAFSSQCGSSPPNPIPTPTPPTPTPPTPTPGLSCSSGKRGPTCSSDSDCGGVSGCVRCARSGYCTCADKSTGRCN